MSDPRLLLAELEATELLLRTLAIESLDYRGILAVERRAHDVCAGILARLDGGSAPVAQPLPARGTEGANVPPVEDATDELLTGAAPTPIAANPVPVARSRQEEVPDDPTDETPPSSSEVLLRWTEDGRASLVERTAAALPTAVEPLVEDEDPTLADGSELEEAVRAAEALLAEQAEPVVEEEEEPLVEVGADELEVAPDSDLAEIEPELGSDADLAEIEPEPEVGSDSDLAEVEPEVDEGYEEPLSQEAVGEPSWLVDSTPRAQPSYLVDEDDTHEAGGRRGRAAPAAPAAGDPWANLVSFETPATDLEDEPVHAGSDLVDEASVHDDPWEEQRKMDREKAKAPASRAAPSIVDPGADALASADSRVSRDDLLPEGEPELDELEELELEPEVQPAELESGDLFEEEAHATMLGGRGETRSSTPAPTPRAAPVARAATPAPAPVAAAPTARAAAPTRGGTPIGGTAGLYGSSAAVPTIRDSDDPRPRAAAIQLNAGGGAKVLGAEEEDEPIEIGEASADELDEDAEGGGGFSIKVQEYEDVEPEEEEEEEEEEYEEEEPPLEPEPAPPSGPSAAEIRALLDAAQSAAQSGNLQQGADLYSDLLDQDPDNLEAHVARGRLYLDLGDYSRAMSDFMVAEDLAPADPEPQVAIGDLYFARKDYRKAIDYFDQALQMAPNHAMAFCRRGISHYYRKNYQEAVVDLEKAKKLDPDIANIQTYISMAKKKVGGK